MQTHSSILPETADRGARLQDHGVSESDRTESLTLSSRKHKVEDFSVLQKGVVRSAFPSRVQWLRANFTGLLPKFDSHPAFYSF